MSYVDEAGQPRLRNSIVGFLDILGFSQSIASTGDQGESQALLNRILEALRVSRAQVRQNLAEDFRQHPTGWALKFFSDNLVVGYPCDGGGSISPEAVASFIIRCSQHYQL